MISRREAKKRGRKSLKRHYFLYVAVCLMAAFIGAEFSSSLDAARSYTSFKEEDDLGSQFLSLGSLSIVYEDPAQEWAEENPDKLPEKEEIQEEEQDHPVLGRRRGVFAKIVNGITSDSFLVTVASVVRNLSGSENLALLAPILLSAGLSFLLWFFFSNMFTAISRRIFLEGRVYDEVPIQRFVYFLRVKKWVRVSWVMFVTAMYRLFWCLTIAGAVIKRYSYYLVPYIMAENPTLSAREAITLSRRMMKGHKWQCFVFELSYVGWFILGAFTLGLTEILYSNPARTAAFSEYYAEYRRLALEGGIPGSEALNDKYLFEQADEETRRKVYADVFQAMDTPREAQEELRGFRGFLARWFGIVLWNSPRERAYEEAESRRIRAEAYEAAARGEAYPGRLHPVPEAERRMRMEALLYIRRYSLCSLVLLFFSFSLIGWLWEVGLHLVSDGEFVNRGVLHGPWLPIYGAGGVMILVLLNRLRKKPVLEFVAAVVLCGIVEYFTAYFLELTHDGMKWWDYSGYFLNLHGRICAEGLLVFGLGGAAIVYVLAPVLDNWFRRIPRKLLIPLCVLLVGVFTADMIYSNVHPNTGKGVSSQETAAAPADPAKNLDYA